MSREGPLIDIVIRKKCNGCMYLGYSYRTSSSGAKILAKCNKVYNYSIIGQINSLNSIVETPHMCPYLNESKEIERENTETSS